MRAIALAAALAAAPLSAAPPPHVTGPHFGGPAARDWSKAAVFLPSGAILIGNPTAKVKLVEYLSLTCPHCGHFAEEGIPPLMASYVRPGLVSLEVRHAVRDGLDMVATLIARCDGPARWDGLSRTLFSTQLDWLGRAQKGPAASLAGGLAAQMKASAQSSGLEAIATKAGLPAARAEACLASKTDADKLAAMSDEAWNRRQIPGTPTFLINGEFTGAGDWPGVERAIKLAL